MKKKKGLESENGAELILPSRASQSHLLPGVRLSPVLNVAVGLGVYFLGGRYEKVNPH